MSSDEDIVKYVVLILNNKSRQHQNKPPHLEIMKLLIKYFTKKFASLKNSLLICTQINTSHNENR